MTVKELRSIITRLPDDMPVHRYHQSSDSDDSFRVSRAKVTFTSTGKDSKVVLI